MEDTSTDPHKDGLGTEDSWHSLSNNRAFAGDHKSKRLVRRVNSQHNMVLKLKQLQGSNSCVKNSFLRSIQVLDSWIPKHIMTVDEIYLRRCLEFIHITASKAAPCDVLLNLGWRNMGVLSDSFGPAYGSTCDLARLDFDCSSAAENGNVVVSPAGQWIVGSIMGSKSMVNILKSPLLRQYGSNDDDTNLKNGSYDDVKGSLEYGVMSSPSGPSSYSLHKLDKEKPILGNHKSGLETLHERIVSMSSANPSWSDCSSSLSTSVTQGMLQFTWKGGKPRFTFSLDDQKLVYVANLWTVDGDDDKGLDHIYLIHSRKDGEKEHEVNDIDAHLIGKIKVSTSFSLCPNNSRIMERQFVLFGGNEYCVGKTQTSSHGVKKNKKLSKKVAEVFRTGNSFKKRTISRFSGSGAGLDNCAWEPFRSADNTEDAQGTINLLGNDLPPNLELAAIVLKDHFPENRQEKVGGWGLKFLKKVGARKIGDTTESLLPSPSCDRDGDCSTSMDVLVPAGVHGGPRTRHCGPSSLIERWRSGGCCDCGGWDLGCPLTILKRRTSGKVQSLQADGQECNLIDLFIQGSQNDASPLRMVNVYDGLYFVHFQSSLSALQCFSIAVAFIHTQCPHLQPKNVQN